ncbi:MAG: quinoprotein dehydrogenase-associated putative ABC transporter substrate-binding protein [Gammaproteobacteria bacterium]|nr:quinoprotein dehydrogenase-associated putative ABC transporter substrate-binding protein [Gammaproteobacteria bacterium]
MGLHLSDVTRGGRLTSLLLATLVMLLTFPVIAEEQQAFRVCADPNNLPFSNEARDGFENRLADLLARDFGMPVEYTWFPQRMGFIRNTLKATEPTRGGYKCDVIMGVPHRYDRAITTEPYYRSTYALVYVKGRELDDVKDVADLLGFDGERKQELRIGVFERTPAAQLLAQHDYFDQIVAYQTMSGDPAAYPGEIVEKELVAGKIDAAILWGPIAGYFAKNAKDVEMVVIPVQSRPGMRFDFSISAAVRHGDGERRDKIQDALDRNADAIKALLEEYNVPLLPVNSGS